MRDQMREEIMRERFLKGLAYRTFPKLDGTDKGNINDIIMSNTSVGQKSFQENLNEGKNIKNNYTEKALEDRIKLLQEEISLTQRQTEKSKKAQNALKEKLAELEKKIINRSTAVPNYELGREGITVLSKIAIAAKQNEEKAKKVKQLEINAQHLKKSYDEIMNFLSQSLSSPTTSFEKFSVASNLSK